MYDPQGYLHDESGEPKYTRDDLVEEEPQPSARSVISYELGKIKQARREEYRINGESRKYDTLNGKAMGMGIALDIIRAYKGRTHNYE